MPDVEAASLFLGCAFGAEPIYDNLTPADPPFAGPEAERQLGPAPGMVLSHMRMLRLGEGAMLGSFELCGADQAAPSRPSDFGLQHVAVYVDDMAPACKRFVDAEDCPLTEPSAMLWVVEGEVRGFSATALTLRHDGGIAGGALAHGPRRARWARGAGA